MPDNFFQGLLYGPTGPETRRFKDYEFGAQLDEAFDGKDNENFVDKTMIMGKYAGIGAGAVTIADVLLFNNKGGLPVALQRIKAHYVPWLGVVLAYQSGVLLSCNLRGKSDQKNHLVGGFAAGAVIGKCTRTLYGGVVSGGLLAILGWFYKDSRMNGYEIWPNIKGNYLSVPGQHGHPFSHKADFTMIKGRMGDRPGYWCRTPEEVEKVYKQGQLGDGNTRDRLW